MKKKYWLCVRGASKLLSGFGEKKSGSQFTSLKLTLSRTCWQEHGLQNLPGHREADKKHEETTLQPGRSPRCAAPTCSSHSTEQEKGNQNSTAPPARFVFFCGRFLQCFFLLFCSLVCIKCVQLLACRVLLFGFVLPSEKGKGSVLLVSGKGQLGARGPSNIHGCFCYLGPRQRCSQHLHSCGHNSTSPGAASCFYSLYVHVQERASFRQYLLEHTKLLSMCHLSISAGISLCFTLLPSSTSHQSHKQHRRFQPSTFVQKDLWCKEELGRSL